MQCSADGHDIEPPDVHWKRFGLGLDQREILRGADGCLPCGGEHGRFRVDTDDTTDIWGKA
jgi:hypothetical protein